MNTISGEKLKSYLLQIASTIDENTDLEDIYKQLSLLADIDASEEDEKNGNVLPHEEVDKQAREWLK